MFEMTLELVYLGAIIAIGVSIMLLFYLAQKAMPEQPEDVRTYMDPLPGGLKLIWPFVMMVSVLVEMLYSNSYLDSVEKKLQHTGVSYILTAEQFIALRYVSAAICTLLTLLVLLSLKNVQEIWLFLSLALLGGFMFPSVWLSDTRKRRELQVIRALPIYLDFTTMAVEAGLNLSGAMQQALNKGPKGALRNEFSIVMRDMRSGVTRAEALKRMDARLQVDDITRFVNAMIQAEKMGSSMAKTLRIQSEQRRTERFQRAEKKAMEAPVKLVFPLIVFIFPVTFMVLGFPIAMKFMSM
ncbi:MAG: type II secretion system F family protein [Pseudomonadales bacterium]|nr:type II secretion system F family protein [Pseudomonadales bacterium]NRA15016.1 type II secretion system F family protein [Oceanospirillaceae bacterium]